MPTAPGSSGPARRWWRRVATLGLVLVLAYGALSLLPDVHEAVDQLADIAPLFLVSGVLLEAAALSCFVALTRTILPPAGRPSFGTIARVDLSVFGVSHVLPGGAATTAALRLHLLTAVGVKRADAVFVATVEGTGSAVVLILLLGLALVVSIPVHGGGRSTPPRPRSAECCSPWPGWPCSA